MSQQHSSPSASAHSAPVASACAHEAGYMHRDVLALRDLLEKVDKDEEQKSDLCHRDELTVTKAQEATKKAAVKAVRAAQNEKKLRTKALLFQDEHL